MFLLEPVNPLEVFTPEDFTEEHRMIAATAADFAMGEVAPHMAELEEQKEGLAPELLRKAGELGLLSNDIPETYGGMELDKITSIVIAENLVAGGSFIISHGAHTGIGTLPIVFFGNDEQKARYLPALATGKKLAAYALTEPGSGSDALAAKTKAVLSEDGKYYILNGTKQFITNAGYADVFITYAKVDGDKFTAFIVDRDTEGFSIGPEEKKMGIKGSSTRSLIFENARVPVENVLFEIGKGHVVAFNILNIGRFKLAAGCLGTAKLALKHSARYALERQQFGLPIAKFGLIQEKLARINTATFVTESMVYRTGGLIDDMLAQVGHTGQETAKGIEEYAVECSINKVYGSETLDMAADEAVQIFGGYGYSQEYPVEQIYRDSRINRIFEGTNEINRLIIPGTLLRRAMKGQLPLLPAAQKLARDLLTMMPAMGESDGAPLAEQQKVLENMKKVFLLVAGAAAQKYMEKLEREQEILGMLADMVIEVFAMESALARTLKAIQREGEEKASLKVDMVRSYFNDTIPKMETWAREALAAMASGDELRTQLAALKKLARYTPVDGVAARRRIAAKVLEAEGYTC
ncbi:acyl-CoA dehydrogenase [Clostridiales bacterium PH28_bin88]|nr:acyl-CoA dehydrogenase [Clostridiales bacterium PH28_bin88]